MDRCHQNKARCEIRKEQKGYPAISIWQLAFENPNHPLTLAAKCQLLSAKYCIIRDCIP
jgi:hypothetical protein